jgi:hypothetical protein
MTRNKALALYSATLLVFAAMTPLRWWLQAKIGLEYQTPDLMFGLDVTTLATFRQAMAQPVGNWTGGDWFKLMHTYTLDMALPAMTGLSFAVFFLRAARKLPNFAAMEHKAQLMAAFIVGFPAVMVDYMENYQVWKLVSGPDAPDAHMAGIISVLTTLKFSCLVFGAAVCLTFALASLRTRKTT